MRFKTLFQILPARKADGKPFKFNAGKVSDILIHLSELESGFIISEGSMCKQKNWSRKTRLLDLVGLSLSGCSQGYKALFVVVFRSEDLLLQLCLKKSLLILEGMS